MCVGRWGGVGEWIPYWQFGLYCFYLDSAFFPPVKKDGKHSVVNFYIEKEAEM